MIVFSTDAGAELEEGPADGAVELEGLSLRDGEVLSDGDSDGDDDKLGELLGTEDGIELAEGAGDDSPFFCIALEPGATTASVLRRRKFPVE
jgi:hypothetical protein